MDKTIEDVPTEVTSSGGPVSLVDDQHFPDGRQSSSGVRIKTEYTASRSDQTFLFATILTESFSTTEDAFSKSRFPSSVSDKTENAPGEECVSQAVFSSESEKAVSKVDSLLNKSQSSSLNAPSKDCVSQTMFTSESTEQFKQPPRKKIKLSGSIKVPVKDLLCGIHTTLCEQDCPFKHNPLVLAICVPDDHELKDYLENHWKLVMKNTWKSALYSLDPKLMKGWVCLVYLTVLYGKYNLLEDLLRVDCSELHVHVGSFQNSPLHRVLKSMHHYMPFSSHQEKLTAFQRILHLLVKYNCNILLVKDRPNEDTILHVCAKKIKELTNQIQSIQLPAHDELKLQGLLNQRQLLERIFKEVINTLKRLCADGSLHHNQVIGLFDCANNAGETMSQILKEDESARNNCRVLTSQVASPLHDKGNTECGKQRKRVAEENLENVMTEQDISQLTTVAGSSGSCTAQNENAHVLSQATNSLGTETFCTNYSSVMTTESPSMTTAQIVTSTQSENSTETITLSTNCPSIQVATGCPKSSSSTTQSALRSPAQTVVANQAENSNEITILSTDCQSVQMQNGCTKLSSSTTQSASLLPAQTVMVDQTENSIKTTILSTECQSFQLPNGCPKSSSSTTQSASLLTVQTVMANQAENSTETTILSTECQSAQVPNDCTKQSPSTTVPQTVVSTQVANPLFSTTLLTDCSSSQTPSGCQKQSTPTVSAASVSGPSKTVDAVRAQGTLTMTVNTVRRLSGRHTFLCSQDCTLKHHKLVELLCATPDHLSMDTASVEAESCANLRDYLKKSYWDISEVVPALEPSLRLPIVHLACFLGKYKALEVLSEFRLHPLLRTAKTEETPLHMTMQLLRYQTFNSIFLSDVIVSIVKTLNQHSHPISLFSAKDNKGNSVLHAMAELISSNVPEAATLLYVYLFRVFVHFILKEQHCIPKSGSLQILSRCLKECNKAGQNVESLLQKSIHGEHLVEYLNGLVQTGRPEMSSETIVESRKDSCGLKETWQIVQKHAGTQRKMCKEPKSLVDFILSEDCKISSTSKKSIVDCYIGEHESRLQLVRLACEELRMMESEIKLDIRRMKLREGELREKRKEQVLLDKKIQLLETLQRTVNER